MNRKFTNQKRYEVHTGDSLYMYRTNKAAIETALKLPAAVIRDTQHPSGFDMLTTYKNGKAVIQKIAAPLFPDRLTPVQRERVEKVYPCEK